MELKPGYKQTEVGIIPEEWEVSSVGREYEIKLGKMLDAEKNVGVPKPYLGNRAVQWDRIDVSDLPTVPMSRADLDRFRLQKGDLLVCEGGEVGRAAIWDAQLEECYYQKALHRLRPLRGFNSVLMAAFLRHWSDCGLLANYVTQTSIAHLPREKFMEVPMPVPPPPEQRAIAEALSDVDGLLGGLDRLIAKKRDLKQAAMQQLLTGQTRLPTFDGAWVVRQFGSLIEHVFPKSTLSSGDGLEHGTYPLLVSGGEPKRTEVAQFRDNVALVFSDGGIFAVKCAKGSFSVTDHCYALKLNAALADMRWFEAWFSLNAQQLDRMTFKGSGLRNLDKPSLRKIEIRCPGLVEQTAIAEALNDMDAELEALEARRDKMSALKHGMMQELLTGRIRLVEGEALHA